MHASSAAVELPVLLLGRVVALQASMLLKKDLRQDWRCQAGWRHQRVNLQLVAKRLKHHSIRLFSSPRLPSFETTSRAFLNCPRSNQG